MPRPIRKVSRRPQFGFTIAELEVVIAIIAIIPAFFATDIFQLRRQAPLSEMRFYTSDLCREFESYFSTYREFPTDLQELGTELDIFECSPDGDCSTEGEQADWGRWEFARNRTVTVDSDRYRLTYSTNPGTILSYLQTLVLIDPAAESFTEPFLLSEPQTPLLIVSTIKPLTKNTDDTAIYCNLETCERYQIVDFTPSTNPPTLIDPIEAAAMQASAEMLLASPQPRAQARDVYRVLKDPEAFDFAYAVFDRNADQQVTLGEFSQASREIANRPIDANATLGERLTKQVFGVVVNTYELTADDEASEEVLHVLGDPSGDPTELFSYDNLCLQTDAYVSEEQLRERLCNRLRLADFLGENELLIPRNRILTNQQRRLNRISGDALSPEKADELQILYEVRKGFPN